MSQNTGRPRPTRRPAAPKLTARQKKLLEARRRRQRTFNILSVCIVLMLVLYGARSLGRRQATPDPVATAAPVIVMQNTAAPTAEPTADPALAAAQRDAELLASRAQYRPTPQREGWLPVFRRTESGEKIICITLDDCFSAVNLTAIIDLVLEYGGKMTIFPVGEQAQRESVADQLRRAWAAGFEIENHTLTHNGLYAISAEELAEEVSRQSLIIKQVLGNDYQEHFLRPKGGDARHDQRIHAYAAQLGMYGIAHWSISGSDTELDKLKESLRGGDIYLFHTTDRDREVLNEFIPYAVAQGYQLVTMNEMFGYEPNSHEPLDGAIDAMTAEIPALQPYEVVPVEYKKPSYAWGVKLIQDRLYELGYLSSAGDGAFGGKTEKAIKAFQSRAGLESTGVADIETQQALFADDAPRA